MEQEYGEKFRSLKAWQRAHALVLSVYQIVKQFPSAEKFILIPQLLRAVISVAANLAEGTKRRTIPDQKHFFNMAETSLEEVKYYLILASDLCYISLEVFNETMNIARETGRLINGLLNRS